MNAYLDEEGLLRVGGRLQAASLNRNQQHPFILAKDSHLSTLLVREAHALTLHGGPQVTRNAILQRFWVIRGNALVRKIIHQCTRYTRFSGRRKAQLMAPLPSERVRPCLPFNTTGVDYAGPIMLRTKRGRGFKAYKGYVYLFVWLQRPST